MSKITKQNFEKLSDQISGAEVKNAERRVPQSMVTSVLINGGLSFAFIIAVLFYIGDPVAASSTPTGYPIIEILFQATNSNAATTVLMALIVAIGIVALFGTLASVSRLVWAFARDGGLPFGRVFTHVSKNDLQT
jgi:choline transport protein